MKTPQRKTYLAILLLALFIAGGIGWRLTRQAQPDQPAAGAQLETVASQQRPPDAPLPSAPASAKAGASGTAALPDDAPRANQPTNPPTAAAPSPTGKAAQTPPTAAAPGAPGGPEPLAPAVLRQIAALEKEKQSRTPAQQKMDSKLVHLAKKTRGEVIAPGVPDLQVDVQPDATGRVLVDMKAEVSDALLQAIAAAGGRVINQFPQFRAVRAEIPVSAMETLAARPDVRSIEPAALATTNVGSVASQADRTHRADAARTTFGVSGAGIKIGVLSDGVNSLSASIANGNLNAQATNLAGQAGAGDEGTAMMELIQDLLPDAQLIFATAFNGDASMAANITALQTAGCSVIVDDVSYFNESPFQDAVIAQAVNSVSAAGAMYFSSAGNSGNKNDGTAGTWEGDFASAGAVTSPLGGTGLVHDFGSGLAYNTVAAGGSSRRVDFFWADPLGASANDYDFFVLDSTGATVLRSSTNLQTGTQNPYESTGTLNLGERIVVVKRTGAANRFLHLDTGRAVLTISTPGRVRGHNAAVAANAFSVAATNVANSPSPNVFVGGATNPVETFSTDGPRRMFFDPTGAPLTPGNFSSTGGTVYAKPDITAADGTSTSVPGFTTFFGTSAAAPHAAAIAAMIRNFNPALSPAQVRAAMTNTALDIEAAGPDRDSGAGIVMAYESIASLPGLDDLTVSGSAFVPSGYVGGPFSPNSVTFTLNNIGATPLNWTAVRTQPWTTLSSSAGTLAPGASTTVIWSLNAGAASLAVGNYSDLLTFTNTGTSFTITRSLTLAVIGYPEIVVEQPEGTGLVDGTSTVAFGNVLVGASATRRFAIKNLGAGPLNLGLIGIDGANAAEFALGTVSDTIVDPGETGYLDVTLAPLSASAKTAALHLASNDVDEASFDIALTGGGTTLGGPISLLRDINRTPNGLAPAQPVVVGALAFFTGTTLNEGTELWRTDGTVSGTFMVRDFVVGAGSGGVSGLTSFNGALYFAANNTTNGTELWKSDGTNAGTVLVKDINSGNLSSSPANFTVIGATLFFTASDATNGIELWKSDGTTAGTVLLANIAAGTTSSSPANLRNVNGTLFFTATDAVNGVELWKSDGTTTVMVKNIAAGSASSSPTNLNALGSLLIFTVNDGTNGLELWSSDGSDPGTALLKDINAGLPGSNPANFVAMGGALYFSAGTVAEGAELWKTDGTPAGTTLVKDIYVGTNGAAPTSLSVVGTTLYFSAFEATNGREPWKSDGTTVGTVLLRNIATGASSSSPTLFTQAGASLFFTAAGNGALDRELWKTDGTEPGTVLVRDINPGLGGSAPANFVNLGGTLIFGANDGFNGQELWRSDGTYAGTFMLLEAQSGSATAAATNLRAVNGVLFFSANDGVNGVELWKSDGTLAGTVMVRNIAATTSSSSPANLANIGSTLYFSATDITNGTELWRSDGTSAGTTMVANIATTSTSSSPTLLTPVGSTLFFSANDAVNGAELWKSDGTAPGTVLLKDINPTAATGSSLANLTSFNGTLFFSANDGVNGQELWKSDGTATGTVLVKDINAGSLSSTPANFRVIGTKLFFTATTASNGVELWATDGTTAGTVLVLDIVAGAGSSSPANLTVVGSTVYFSATATGFGFELWKSDGTAGGTVLVKDIFSGTSSSSPTALADIGGTLYFRATTSAEGTELWKSDGTGPGTVLVSDIAAGPTSSLPTTITNVYGSAYMNATSPAAGAELWKSDGTAATTALVFDLLSGAGSSTPTNLTVVGTLLFFTARGPDVGSSELFVVNAAPPPDITVERPVGTSLVDGAGTLNFGFVALGTNGSIAATVRNTGIADLTGFSIAIDGANAGDFSVTANPAAPVAASSGSTTFTVRFTPTGTGTRTASLHLSSNDPDESPFDLTLTGTSSGTLSGPVPERIYYKFDGTGASVPNLASAPVGTNPAPIQGAMTQGGAGQFGAGLIGSGGLSSSDRVNTGWATSLSGSWTISLYLNNIQPSATLFYFFGDSTAGSFRCFTNGIAGADNLMLRGSGIIDVIVPDAALATPTVTHFVYNAAVPEIRAYVNGVLVNTVAQSAITISGTGPFLVGGYAANNGLPDDGVLDEFRLYNRALTAAEISSSWNATLPLLPPAPDIAVEEPAGTGLADGTNTINHGTVALGANAFRTVTVRNAGTTPLTGLSVSNNGSHPLDFALGALGTTTLAPGDSTSFTVTFAPTAVGSRSAALHVASNDPDENPFDVSLTGVGLTQLEGWRLLNFGSIANSGAGANANDFEFDGLSNFLEFCLSKDPKQSSQPVYSLIRNGTNLEFTYTRAKAALLDGVVFSVEWLDDLGLTNWSSVGVSQSILADNGVLQQVKATLPAGSNGHRFVRLKVQGP